MLENLADFELWGTREVARLLALVERDRDDYRELISSLPTPIVIAGSNRVVVRANRAFLELVGLRAADVRGKTIDQILSGLRASPVRTNTEDETAYVVEPETSSRQSASIQAERMDALQSVAGRLAHDLNNPLMILMANLEELQVDRTNTALPDIMGAIQRISAVAARLTEFARKDANPAQAVNVTQLIADLESRIKQAAGKGVTTVIDQSNLVWAMADPKQLEEVLLALVSGMERRSNLHIRCSKDIGGGITIRVEGAGQKISFEAALTAKTDSPEAKSGMALARAYLWVHQWGGDIETSNGECRVTLASPKSEPAPEPTAAPAKGGATILLVDDEAGIRGPLIKFLRQKGYLVLEAASGDAALKMARGQQIDLLLTDVQMPGMSGGDLAQALYKADPRLKVLYMSGYTPDERVRSGAFPPGAGFLSKPFTLAALLERVRTLLEH